MKTAMRMEMQDVPGGEWTLEGALIGALILIGIAVFVVAALMLASVVWEWWTARK